MTVRTGQPEADGMEAGRVDEADLVVIGLGAMGAFAFREAARRGLSVVGLERQPRVDHEFGASGGQTRIFRLAYKEGAQYLPFLRESLQHWEDMQRTHREPIWQQHGALMIGNPSHPEVVAYRDCVRDNALEVEEFGRGEFEHRWPQHRLLDGDAAYFDPCGGLLRPQAAIRAAVRDACEAGGRVRTSTQAVSWTQDGRRLTIQTAAGAIVRARRVLLACGPWASELAPLVNDFVRLLVVPLHWFGVDDPSSFGVQQFPVGIRRSGNGANLSFFPAVDGGGIKVNLHEERISLARMPERMDAVPRELSLRASQAVAELFRGVDPTPKETASFVDGYTADKRPLFVRLAPQAWAVAGFSGQGFKMAPAFARIVVDMLTGGEVPALQNMPIRVLG